MATLNQPKPELTFERLHEVLRYDSGTGICRWRIARPHRAPGDIAGHLGHWGYWIISIDDKHHRRARLAWLYVRGEWPDGELDHEDRVRDHDWISNLRPANQTQNNANRVAYRNNKSGFKGVHLFQGRFRAMIRINGKGQHIGMYDTPEEAHAAYMVKAVELFGDFANAV